MAEKMSEVFEMYDVRLDHIGRGRGAMLPAQKAACHDERRFGDARCMNTFRQRTYGAAHRFFFRPCGLIHHRCRGIRRIGTACQKRLLYFVHKADG